MKRLGIAESLRECIRQEMRRDERVFCIEEDIGIPGGWGGAFTVTLGLEKEFPERMINTPISENGFFGVALGAALMGLRPIVDVQYADFLLLAMDQVVNQIAKMRYMSGGKLTVPLVMRAPVGVTGRGAQHSQSIESFLLPVAGIKLVVPATAYDAVGLLRSAVRCDDPVLMVEHKLLYGSKGVRAESGAVDASSEIPEEDYVVPIGKAAVRREGADVTIIATLLMMHRSLQAADLLEQEGISVEVIDPRSLVPLDWETVKSMPISGV
jgi:pyruvate dehydrogenase E1 component beta subunit